MQQLKLVSFVAGHTIELQGLRTALLGALCLAMAAWQLGLAIWDPHADSVLMVSWMPLILIGWHLDDRLAAYYDKRMGMVLTRHPYRRLFALGGITVTYAVLWLWERWMHSPVALSALFLAAVQLHIGLVSGEGYRRHYVVGAVVWCGLSLSPMLTLPPDARAVLWLSAIGVTLTLLGWRDHLLLVRALPEEQEVADA